MTIAPNADTIETARAHRYAARRDQHRQSGAGAAQPVTGAPSSVTVDLARAELEKRLGVPLELVVIDGAGKSFETVKPASCDIGFWRSSRRAPPTSISPPPM